MIISSGNDDHRNNETLLSIPYDLVGKKKNKQWADVIVSTIL